MSKRRNKRSIRFKNDQQSKSLTIGVTPVTDTTETTHITSQSNDEDFLDNTERMMNKKRKHVENFYNGSKNVSG